MLSSKGFLDNIGGIARSIVRRGLGRTLFVCFLFISFVPVAIVSRLSFQNAQELLVKSVEQSLVASIRLKKDLIESYLSKKMAGLQRQAQLPANVEFLQTLHLIFRNSGLSPAGFVATSDWESVVRSGGKGLRDLQMTAPYYDVMLIDSEGNVLFSAIREEHLGSNVFRDMEGAFGKACRMALKTDRPAWAEAAYHGLNNDRLVSFMVQVMNDEGGREVGFLAFGVPLQHVNSIMKEEGGIGETYLIGPDLVMRSDSIYENEPTLLKKKVDTVLARNWHESVVGASASATIDGEELSAAGPYTAGSLLPGENRAALRYKNYRGEKVLGLCCTVEVLRKMGVPWAIVAEVGEDEAFGPVRQLQAVIVGDMFITGIVVFLLAGFLSWRIVWPVRQLSRWAQRVAEGDLSYEKINTPANEIGEMNASFKDVVASFRTVADVCEAISVGDLNKMVAVKGQKDMLGKAVNLMGENLRGVVRQADNIAKGDYSVEIHPHSERDELGVALLHMTETLRKVTSENERALEEARQLITNLDKLPTPVFTMDRDFNITYINPAGAAIAGLSQEDCIGAKCQGLFRSTLCHTRDCPAEQVKRDDRVATGEYIIDPDDLNLPMEFTSAPIRDADGNTIGVLVHLLDITKRRAVMEEMRREEWLRAGRVKLGEIIRGEQDVFESGKNVITFLASYLDARAGAIYIADDDHMLRLIGSYAFTSSKNIPGKFRFGEGLVGQAAREGEILLLSDVPEDYVRIRSGLGEALPKNIVVAPFLYAGKVKGVVELGSLHTFTDWQIDFLKQVLEGIAISIASAESRTKLQKLLGEMQKQAEKLQSQQEELRVTNEELEERTRALEEQQENIRKQNEELEKVRQGLEQKTRDLEKASNYKSQFLANMSHELRTPLNSMLLLSRLLSENKDGNLTEKQKEYAGTIHAAGAELLVLINEVLDLSKVEAGKIELNFAPLDFTEFVAGMKSEFQEFVAEKEVTFTTELAADLADVVWTDPQRVGQIVKNFLSNAFKFTERGSVTLHIGNVEDSGEVIGKSPEQEMIAIAVVDTGIGIPRDKQEVIFDEFQQADGTMTRKYGGTGLGLSISKRLADLLGGAIRLESEEEVGSTFILYLPRISGEEGNAGVRYGGVAEPSTMSETDALQVLDEVDNQENDRTLLIIEDDESFVMILQQLAERRGFKCLVATNGEMGLYFASFHQPSAIALDIGLPGVDGWAVMERLKDNPKTRHIPVHIISAREEEPESDALRMGAIGYLKKPATAQGLEDVFSRLDTFLKGGGEACSGR